VAGYTPETSAVNPATDTVSGQYDRLMKSDNPLITGARARSDEGMNARGLLNSSMALGAGEQAAAAAALPIAAADASTYTANRMAGDVAKNTAMATTANAQNVGSLQQLQGHQAMQQQTLKGTQSAQLANIEGSYKALLQSSASATAMFNGVAKNINDIMNDNTISAAQKDASVAHQKALLLSQLAVIGGLSNADIVGLLDFSNG
jgi:hypothetical protein